VLRDAAPGRSPTLAPDALGAPVRPDPPRAGRYSIPNSPARTRPSGAPNTAPHQGAGTQAQAQLVNTAEFVAPDDRAGWQRLRYELLNTLWYVTSNERQRGCCRWRVDGAHGVSVARNESSAYLVNVQRCGRVACPVCGSKISYERGTEISRAVEAHLQSGGGVATGVLTLSHSVGDRLEPMLDLLLNGWRAIAQDRRVRDIRDIVGVVGMIRGFEVTHGRNSWHGHLHYLVLTERALSAHELKQLQRAFFRVWSRVCESDGRRLPAGAYNRLERVRTAQAIGRYVSKVSLGHELTGGDNKTSRGRSPIRILYDFTQTGDVDDLDLWREYEQAIHGRQLLTWSRGLKAHFRVEHLTDHEIVSREEGGSVQFEITPGDYTDLCRISGAIPTVLRLVETGRIGEAQDYISEAVDGLRAKRQARDGPTVLSYVTGEA